MKASDNELDMMLFDYLEGNFSAEETRQVEEIIASDPLVQEELNHWKSSYIQTESLNMEVESFDTSAIEANLVQQAIPSINFTIFLNSILVLCATFIAGTNPSKELTSIPERQIIEMVEFSPSKPLPRFTGVSQRPGMEIVSVSQEEAALDIEEAEPLPEVNQNISLAGLQDLTTLSPEFAEFEVEAPRSIDEFVTTAKNTPVSKKMIRNSSREYRRMKNRAHKKRMAREFMKGDVPYVVPIDTRNF